MGRGDQNTESLTLELKVKFLLVPLLGKLSLNSPWNWGDWEEEVGVVYKIIIPTSRNRDFALNSFSTAFYLLNGKVQIYWSFLPTTHMAKTESHVFNILAFIRHTFPLWVKLSE